MPDRRHLLLAAAGVLAGCATAPADEAPIAALLQASADAWNRGDLTGHLSIYATAMTAMTKNGPRTGVDEMERSFRAAYFDAAGRPKQQLRFDSLVVRRLGTDAALSTGRYTLEGGALATASGWFTLVWQRTPAGWKAVHDHAS
jgi:ketosteroid isomerase-like protein